MQKETIEIDDIREVVKLIEKYKPNIKYFTQYEYHHAYSQTNETSLVFKSPELNNPFDPNSGETGNTLYGLTEIYNGPEGVQAHMTLGQQREAMFAELVSLTNTYSVAGILGAPVIAAME